MINDKSEYNIRYYCERCDQKRDAKRWVCFRQLPPILIFSLSRFEYDFDNDQRVKNCNYFHYPLTLDMQPFHESIEQAPFDISKMKSAQDLSLFEPSVDPCSPHLYDLSAVIIHTGNSGNYGHYHAYMKDLCNQGTWNTPEYDPSDRLEEDDNDSVIDNEVCIHDDVIDQTSPFFLANIKLGNSNTSLSSSSEVAEKIVDEGQSNVVEEKPSDHENSGNDGKKDDENNTTTATSTTEGNDTKQNETTSTSEKSEIHNLDEDAEDNHNWYDFNDSNVTPIKVNKLRRQFGGKTECAYMLVYRHRSLQVDQGTPTDHGIEVPQHLLQFIENENLKVQEEREEWERAANQIRIHIYSTDHFFVDEEGIARVVPLDSTQSPDSIDTKISISIDQRLYVSYIKENIKLLMNEDYLHGCDDVDLMQLLPISIKEGVVIPGNDGNNLNDKLTMIEAAILNGDMLMVWNGFHVNRSEWNPANKLISIDLKHVSRSNDETIISEEDPALQGSNEIVNDLRRTPLNINTYPLEVASLKTIGAFKTQLEELTHIPPSSQILSLVCKKSLSGAVENVFYHPDDLDEDDITILDNPDATFAEYNIPSHGFLIIEEVDHEVLQSIIHLNDHEEKKKQYSEVSIVNRFLQIQKTCLQVFIVDQISIPEQTLYFLVEKTMTLYDLKLKALNRIKCEIDPDQTRLRRTSVNFQGLYRNEEVTVHEAGISNFARIILEAGESPSSRSITIKFKHLPSKEQIPVVISRNWSVQQMRFAIMEKVGLCTDLDYRLRRTDFWGHPTSIMEEDRLVQFSGVNSEDLFVLEAGKVPTKGQILVQVKIFENFPISDDEFIKQHSSSHRLISASAQNGVVGDRNDEGKDAALQSGNDGDDHHNNSSDNNDQTENSERQEGGNNNDNDDDGFFPHVSLEEEKKEKTFKWKLFSPSIVCTASTPKSYVVNELPSLTIASSATLRELKQLMYSSYSLAAKTDDHIRVWSKNRILRNPNELLRNYYVGNNAQLVIQIMDEVDPWKGVKEVCILWLFMRNQFRTFNRPIEFIFDNSQRYERSLFDCISQEFQIPKDKLVVAKYFPFSHNWQILDADEEEEPVVEADPSKVDDSNNNSNDQNDSNSAPQETTQEVSKETSEETSKETSSSSQEDAPSSSTDQKKNQKSKKKGHFVFKDGGKNINSKLLKCNNHKLTMLNYVADIIAVRDKRLDENDEDNFMSQVVTVKVPAHSSYSKIDSVSSSGRPRRVEAELKIHVDNYEYEYEEDDVNGTME